MDLRWFKDYGREIHEDFSTLAKYVRLSLSGNKVERLTDFRTTKHPVLLLYGFGATRRVMSVLEHRLRKDRFGVFSLNLGGFLGTFNTDCIEELAKLVKRKVEGLCKKYGMKKISIVGHSKGGIIGHYYIKRLGGARRVRALITLGAPHYGNPWVLFGLISPLSVFSRSLWQMYPMSPFLKRLNAGPFPKNVRFTSIYSKKDKICFYKSAILDISNGEGNLKNIELKKMGHADYLMKKKAYDVIKRELMRA